MTLRDQSITPGYLAQFLTLPSEGDLARIIGRDIDPSAIHKARKSLRIWFALDTLEYLRRGGRIGKAQAWLGGTLRIKPILSLEFEIVPVLTSAETRATIEPML